MNISCPQCSEESIKFGIKAKKGGKFQRYQCKKCGHVFYDTEAIKEGNKK